ncbi:hypothetical protein [endosymbiont of Riftia pachyptila]|uniref:hypothetical protein n=1 Tax=endosymbiont of Riftia pachyptila TaxID=54396 RepID=UPI00111263BC|nr:hypothetical protein [endosymbiont of Riftia pachyptila]
MKAKIIALCILAGFGVSQAEAAPGYSYAPGPRYQQLQPPGPDQVLKQGIEQLISFMHRPAGAIAASACGLSRTEHCPFLRLRLHGALGGRAGLSDDERDTA